MTATLFSPGGFAMPNSACVPRQISPWAQSVRPESRQRTLQGIAPVPAEPMSAYGHRQRSACETRSQWSPYAAYAADSAEHFPASHVAARHPAPHESNVELAVYTDLPSELRRRSAAVHVGSSASDSRVSGVPSAGWLMTHRKIRTVVRGLIGDKNLRAGFFFALGAGVIVSWLIVLCLDSAPAPVRQVNSAQVSSGNATHVSSRVASQ